MKIPPDFKELLEEFAREGVDHVLIGGYAFAFHAEPRATKDLDILLEGSDENRERAARALGRYGAPANVVEAVRHLSEAEVAYMGSPPLRIDFQRAIDGISAGAVLKNAVETTWDGIPVRIISLPDLIANKRAAGRPQDLVDVSRLERVRK